MLKKICHKDFNKVNIEELNIFGYEDFSKYAGFLEENEKYFVNKSFEYPQLIINSKGFIIEKYWKDKNDFYIFRNGPSLISYNYDESNKITKKTLAWYKNKKNFRDFNKPSFIVKSLKEKSYHWTNENGLTHRLNKPAIIKKDFLNNIIYYSYYHNGLKGNLKFWYPTDYKDNNFFYYKDGFDITNKIKKISLDNGINLFKLNKKEIDFLKINLN